MVPDAISLPELRRALVVKLRHHGDVLLTSPVFSVLKRAAPACEIDALVYRDTAPMLDGHPALSRIVTIDRAWKELGLARQATEEWRLLSDLRARRYDLIVHLTEHPRGAWLARWLGPRWSVAPYRRSRLWRGSFSHFYPHVSNPRRHTVETNLDALRRLGIQPAEEDRKVVLVPGEEAEVHVDELLIRHGLNDRKYVHIHPASRWLFKCWTPDKVAQLADALSTRGLAVVFTAAPDAREKTMLAEILAQVRLPVTDLSGQLSLKELAALAGRASLFVGVDSAPMHIAAAMATPCVALFGPSGEIEWGPWRTAHRIVLSDAHPCRPCGLDGCGGGKISECLTTLPVRHVLAACDELL
jgi:heptosyltransferase-3